MPITVNHPADSDLEVQQEAWEQREYEAWLEKIQAEQDEDELMSGLIPMRPRHREVNYDGYCD